MVLAAALFSVCEDAQPPLTARSAWLVRGSHMKAVGPLDRRPRRHRATNRRRGPKSRPGLRCPMVRVAVRDMRARLARC
jgi:hypothetical protein